MRVGTAILRRPVKSRRRAEPGWSPRFCRPVPATTGPQPVRRRPAPSWLRSPATYMLVGINCLVYLAMVANKVSPTNPTIDQLMQWGADNAGEVLIGGQWWRIVTAMFVHVGFLHIAINMWCLWNLALLAEPLMGLAGVFGGVHPYWRGGQPAVDACELVVVLGRLGEVSRFWSVPGRSGRLGGGLRHCRSADRAAQISAPAGAAL